MSRDKSITIPLDQSDVRRLLDWFSTEGIQYPWADTADPYAIWVSEVMLQQTTIAAVLPRFHRWMKRFPGTAELAGAEESEVLREWEGLGYYNRARNLASAAREIQARYGGTIPDDPAELRSLPGVGDYISAALAGFAFGRRTAAIDANGRRIAMRLSCRPVWNVSLETVFRSAVETLMPQDNPGILNAAIMQLGQIVCLPRKPRCEACPLDSRCLAFAQGLQNEIPGTRKRVVTFKTSSLALLVRGESILMKKKTNGIGKGLWVFPTDSEIDFPKQHIRGLGELSEYVHNYTRYRETLRPKVYRAAENASFDEGIIGFGGFQWLRLDRLEECPMPTVYRQIARDLVNFLKQAQRV